MTEYRAPLRDMRFVLNHVVDLPALARLDGLSNAEPDVVDAVLDEAGRFASEVIAPTNQPGDRQGSRLENGVVRTPDGFRDVYRQFREAGWNGVPFEPEYGGGGLPWAVASAVQEMVNSANLSFALCPLLNQGAIEAIAAHAAPPLKATYLAKLVSGEWTGTMNLTEPQAGSDVGALKARAVPAGDGSWRITGTKIFITYGEHDMAENIVHLVLARTPNAPAGTRGISLFLVPKFLVNPDGSLGARNDLRCVSLEHKLGIHGSPTCVMSYGDNGGAVGWLVGEENAGMRCMFTMMNNARLSVGLQGVAMAERAFQQARAYAQERKQGRPAGRPPTEDAPIIAHPDVRRMLMAMKSQIEAMRALVYVNAEAIDIARRHKDASVRAEQQGLVELLTPVSKGWCTELGCEIASLAVQMHGGMGFVEETGVAQYYRDVRITPIYEGTTGIQAMDLVGRKLPMRGGAVVRGFLAQMRRLDGQLAKAGAGFDGIRGQFETALDALEQATDWMLATLPSAPNRAAAGAAPYLKLFGIVTGGWLLARQALGAAQALAAAPGDAFLEGKIASARFFAANMLPLAGGLGVAATTGAEVLDPMADAVLVA